jgi:hypothetical protein
MPSKHANERARSLSRGSKRGRKARLAVWGRIAAASAVAAAGVGATAAPAFAQNQNGASNYHFQTLDNNLGDPTFNQLLGINKKGVIAGYFGSGMIAGHPNKGYLLTRPYGQGQYHNENWPQSMQTQVTGLNDNGVTVGFWSTMNNNPATTGGTPVNDNRGFVRADGYFIDGDFPTDTPNSPPTDQLLGVNDKDVAVGFYTDVNGATHAYTFNIRHNRFAEVFPSGITNPTAAAINNNGDIAGFGNQGSSTGPVVGYLLRRNGHVIVLSVPGANQTQALGINDNDEVVGTYQTGSSMSPANHGFTWTPQGGFVLNVDDPNGMGTTTINGVNDEGQLVGFYVDGNNNTDGLLANPVHHNRNH